MTQSKSTQKEVAALLTDVRVLFEHRTNTQAWGEVSRAREHYTKRLAHYGMDGVQVSPYRYGVWTVSAFYTPTKEHTAGWVSVSCTAEELFDSPRDIIAKVLSAKAAKERIR